MLQASPVDDCRSAQTEKPQPMTDVKPAGQQHFAHQFAFYRSSRTCKADRLTQLSSCWARNDGKINHFSSPQSKNKAPGSVLLVCSMQAFTAESVSIVLVYACKDLAVQKSQDDMTVYIDS